MSDNFFCSLRCSLNDHVVRSDFFDMSIITSKKFIPKKNGVIFFIIRDMVPLRATIEGFKGTYLHCYSVLDLLNAIKMKNNVPVTNQMRWQNEFHLSFHRCVDQV